MLEINSVNQGDCLELMKNIPDKSIDIVLTDLPYNHTHNDWDIEINLQNFWSDVTRVKKQKTPIIMFGQGMFTAKLMFSNQKLWRYNLVWKKDRSSGFLNANRQPLRIHEDIVIFYESLPVYNPIKVKGKPTHSRGIATKPVKNHNYGKFNFNDKINDMKFPISVLEFSDEHPPIHPTQKPIKLFEYLIKTYSNENDLVLDCCAGSGTTAIACINTNRKYICIEKEQKYFEIMKNRVSRTVKPLEAFN